MGWRNRPKFINYCPEWVDYVLFIDENGCGDMKSVARNHRSLTPNQELLTITGIAIKASNLGKVKGEIMDLKNTYWENGMFKYGKRNKRVCFHSRNIRKKEGPFNPAVINHRDFTNDLAKVIQRLPMTIFSATIDKYRHFLKYNHPVHPYNLCLNFIIERFVKFHLEANEKAIIVIEARGKEHDTFTLEHIKRFLDHGNQYISSRLLKNSIKGVYFNSKWSKTHNELKSYFGLEIADLCSYPIYKFCKHGTKDYALQCYEGKIHNYPRYEGCGLKRFP